MSDQLRSIYSRWQNLEADKAAISEDLKELFAEAKSNGYNTKALREAFRTANLDNAGVTALDEHAVLVAVYLADIVGTKNAPRAHPRIAHEDPSLVGANSPLKPPTPASGAKEAPATIPDDDLEIPACLRRYA